MVLASPSVSFASLSSTCNSSSNITLAGGSPSGGIYSGTGVNSGIFNPSSAGVGTHLLSYTYTATNGCKNSDTSNISVKLGPSVSLNKLADVCDSSSAFSLGGGSPLGGTFTGNYVSVGKFDPVKAIVGRYLIRYTVTSTNGCAGSDTSSITVRPKPIAAHMAFTSMCVKDKAISLTGGSPTGGSYHGVGVSNGRFDPLVAGTGNHSITYSVSNSYGCRDSISLPLTVDTLPTVTIVKVGDLCENAPSLMLTGSTPANGLYAGNGISSGNLSPRGLFGTQRLIYRYTDANGCTGADTTSYKVLATPKVSLSAIKAMCVYSGNISLSGGAPLGGKYSGKAVTSGIFNSTTAGPGSHIIRYSFVDSNKCADSAQTIVQVNALPNVTFTLPNKVCLNTSISLNSGLPAGGKYTGNNISSMVYKATSSATDTLVYTYVDSNGCVNTDSAFISGETPPTLSYASIADACFGNQDSVSIDSALPVGGIYKGVGVNSKTGNYAVTKVGIDSIWYIFSSGVCTDSISQTIRSNPQPVVSFSMSPFCDNRGAFGLVGGNPAGGSYSGKRVSNGIYQPLQGFGGSDTVNYSFTDSLGCSNQRDAIFTIYLSPRVGLTVPDSLCQMSDSVKLTGGSPTGGVFSGNAVNGQYFQPLMAVLGANQIKYVFEDGNQCKDSALAAIYVSETPVFTLGNDTDICGDAVLNLTSGLGSSYLHTWNTGSNGTAISVNSGGQFILKVLNPDAKSCAHSDTIEVAYENACVGIEEMMSERHILVFPNPSNGKINIDMKGLKANGLDVTVLNSTGQVVMHKRLQEEFHGSALSIDLNNEPNGVYFVVLKGDGWFAHQRVTMSK